jgi:hypothetical protein
MARGGRGWRFAPAGARGRGDAAAGSGFGGFGGFFGFGEPWSVLEDFLGVIEEA